MKNVLYNIGKLLAPHEKLVIAVPGGPISAFDRLVGHLRHYTDESPRELLQRAVFRSVEVRKYGFPSFDLYRLLVVSLGNRLIVKYERPIGWSKRVLMFIIRISFSCNSTTGKRGFQLVPVAQLGT